MEQVKELKVKMAKQIDDVIPLLDLQTQLNTEDQDPIKWQLVCPRESARKTESEVDIESLNKERDILEVIEQDVNRTMQEIELFTDAVFKENFRYMLYLWTTENREIGYGQGMNEILAMFLYAFL